MKFHYRGQKLIAICIVDNVSDSQTGWSREITKNLADQLIYKFSAAGFDIFIGDNEDQLLNETAAEDYTHSVMISACTSMLLNDNLISNIEEHCKKTFAISGHILDRFDEYYELHHQFYIINLQEFKNLNYPVIGNNEESLHEQVVPLRSQENVHDNYVPLWISAGTEIKKYISKRHGWNIISKVLSADKKIIDIGYDIRNSKQYFYPEHDHVFQREISELYYQQFFSINFVPGYNSDTIIENIDFDLPIKQYVTVGSGFNWIKNIKNLNFTDDTKLYFVDISSNALALTRDLIDNFDGKDYVTFYRSFISKYMPHGRIQMNDRYLENLEMSWIKFLKEFPEFDECWHKVKKLNAHFININFMGEFNFDWINPDEHTLINVSDLYTHGPHAFLHPLKYRVYQENNLISKLKEINDKIYLVMSSRSTDGFRSNIDRRLFGRVRDFDLTDINQLNEPFWHAGEWYSPKILR